MPIYTKEQLAQIRRRVEDCLRKTTDQALVIRVAEMCKVKLEVEK